MASCPHCGEQLPRKSKYPQVSIIARKHPLGFRSPTGKYQIRSMALEGDMVRVQILYNRSLMGWAFPLNEYTKWITFNIEGSSQPFGLGSAWAYWQKHNGPTE